MHYLKRSNHVKLINRLVAADEMQMKNDAVLLKIKLGSKAIFTCWGVMVKSTSTNQYVLA